MEDDDIGNPDSYIFSWTRKNDSEFKAQNNGTLIIYLHSLDYQDNYSCVPENIAGTGGSGEIQLTIKGKINCYHHILLSQIAMIKSENRKI